MKKQFEYCSLAKEGLLWIVCPSPSFSSRGLKLIWKSAHKRKHCKLGSSKPEYVVRLVTHTTRYKLCCCPVVYTSIRCLAHRVTHCFLRLVVHNIDSSAHPHLSARQGCTAHGPFFERLQYDRTHVVAEFEPRPPSACTILAIVQC